MDLTSLRNQKATQARYVLMHLLSFPFWGLLYLLPVILYKDLNASPFQIATIIALKPMVSLFSPYWSQLVHGKQHRLIPNLYWANLIKFTPFLFTPFIQSSWYFIISFGVFMMLSRGTIPAWMEILQNNLPEKLRNKTAAIGSTIDYFGTALLPILFGWSLDNVPGSWRWFFLATAILGVFSTICIYKIPNQFKSPQKTKDRKPLHFHLLSPWRNFTSLLSQRPDFFRFQVGFFLGGAGLMIIQPILPKYFVDTLNLSYTGMLAAIAACKGIGFTLSTPLWVRRFNHSNIFPFCSSVTAFATLFPILLIGAKTYGLLVYGAYFIYGIMQGGSELSWKMSGPIFANTSDSAPFSSVNVLTVGIRGIILPYLGSLLFFATNNVFLLLMIGGTFSLLATWAMYSYGRKYRVTS